MYMLMHNFSRWKHHAPCLKHWSAESIKQNETQNKMKHRLVQIAPRTSLSNVSKWDTAYCKAHQARPYRMFDRKRGEHINDANFFQNMSTANNKKETQCKLLQARPCQKQRIPTGPKNNADCYKTLFIDARNGGKLTQWHRLWFITETPRSIFST